MMEFWCAECLLSLLSQSISFNTDSLSLSLTGTQFCKTLCVPVLAEGRREASYELYLSGRVLVSEPGLPKCLTDHPVSGARDPRNDTSDRRYEDRVLCKSSKYHSRRVYKYVSGATSAKRSHKSRHERGYDYEREGSRASISNELCNRCLNGRTRTSVSSSVQNNASSRAYLLYS